MNIDEKYTGFILKMNFINSGTYGYFSMLNSEKYKNEAFQKILNLCIPDHYKLAAAIYINDESYVDMILAKEPDVTAVCSPFYFGAERSREILSLFLSRNEINMPELYHIRLFQKTTIEILNTRNPLFRKLPKNDFSPIELALKIGNEKIILKLLNIKNIFINNIIRNSHDFSDNIERLMKLVFLNCDNYTFNGYFDMKIKQGDLSFLSTTIRFMEKKYFESFCGYNSKFISKYLKVRESEEGDRDMEEKFFEKIYRKYSIEDFAFTLIMYGNIYFIEKYIVLIPPSLKETDFFQKLYRIYRENEKN